MLLIVLLGIFDTGGVGSKLADGDGALLRIVAPGGDVLGGAIVDLEAAVVEGEHEGVASDDGFGERGSALLLAGILAGRVPLVDDLVVADDEQGFGVQLGEAVAPVVESFAGQAVALGRIGGKRKIGSEEETTGQHAQPCGGRVQRANSLRIFSRKLATFTRGSPLPSASKGT